MQENLTKQEIFPKDRKRCTRCPVVLEIQAPSGDLEEGITVWREDECDDDRVDCITEVLPRVQELMPQTEVEADEIFIRIVEVRQEVEGIDYMYASHNSMSSPKSYSIVQLLMHACF